MCPVRHHTVEPSNCAAVHGKPCPERWQIPEQPTHSLHCLTKVNCAPKYRESGQVHGESRGPPEKHRSLSGRSQLLDVTECNCTVLWPSAIVATVFTEFQRVQLLCCDPHVCLNPARQSSFLAHPSRSATDQHNRPVE